jgi:hypothetical protein
MFSKLKIIYYTANILSIAGSKETGSNPKELLFVNMLHIHMYKQGASLVTTTS